MKLTDLPQLSNLLQTRITTADGEPMVLLHAEPLTDEERAEVESYTKDELISIFSACCKNPVSFKLENPCD